MRLPDAELSRAVLIGTATYPVDSGFTPLPSVTRNLEGLAAALRSRAGIADVTVVVDPVDARDFRNALRSAISEAEDVLLFYYAGHGVAVHDDLGLTHIRSESDAPGYTSVRYRDLRADIEASHAAIKVVVLDCCHSGKAYGAQYLAGNDRDVFADLTEISGAFVLTATDAISKFAAEVGPNGYTALTGALLEVLESGYPSADEFLTLNTVYTLLRRRLRAGNHPTPKSRGTNSAAQLALARNPQWTGPAADIKRIAWRADTAAAIQLPHAASCTFLLVPASVAGSGAEAFEFLVSQRGQPLDSHAEVILAGLEGWNSVVNERGRPDLALWIYSAGQAIRAVAPDVSTARAACDMMATVADGMGYSIFDAFSQSPLVAETVRLNVEVNIGDEFALNSATRQEIRMWVPNLAALAETPFLILSRPGDGMTYIQTYRIAADYYALEIQHGSTDEHYETELDNPDDIVELMLDWIGSDFTRLNELTWSKSEI